MLKFLKKQAAKALAMLGFGATTTSAFAVPPTTVAELTTGISFADVGLAVLAITALLIAYYMIKKSGKEVIHTVKSL